MLIVSSDDNFANSFDPYQAQQNVEPGSKLFDTLMVFLKEVFEKQVDLNKKN